MFKVWVGLDNLEGLFRPSDSANKGYLPQFRYDIRKDLYKEKPSLVISTVQGNSSVCPHRKICVSDYNTIAKVLKYAGTSFGTGNHEASIWETSLF